MSPSSTSEARKRREGDPDTGPEPLPGYVLTTAGEIRKLAEAGTRSEWRWLGDIPSDAATTDGIDGHGWTSIPPHERFADDLVIARPPRPRTVAVELPEDMRDRWAVGLDIPLGSDLLDITAACRASRDAEQ